MSAESKMSEVAFKMAIQEQIKCFSLYHFETMNCIQVVNGVDIHESQMNDFTQFILNPC